MASSIDSNFNPLQPDVLKYEYRQVVGGNALDKPTFGARFKTALLKGLGFLGRIGGAVAPFLGPLGVPLGAGMYGMSRVSDGLLGRMYQKRAQESAMDAQAAQMGSNPQVYTPGWDGAGGAMNSDPQIQWAPSSRGYEKEIMQTLGNSEGARSSAIQNISQGGINTRA